MRKAPAVGGRLFVVTFWVVLLMRIESLIVPGIEAFQLVPTTTTTYTFRKQQHEHHLTTTSSIHSQRVSPLFHRFNPLRVNNEGVSSTAKTVIPSSGRGLDTSAILKYTAAIVIQMSLVSLIFFGLDKFVVPHVRIPFFINAAAMYFFALKSRTLNPLSNRRPKPQTKEIEGAATQRKMPTWTPPGFVFPIVWLLLIGPLRAVTSAMIIQSSGGLYTTKALLSLMLHLSIGDVWNTINNVEKRYGTSVLGVLCVWISAAVAAWNFYQVLPLAGRLLSLKLVWLTVATSLVTRTWQLNPNPATGKIAPLLPTKGDGFVTQFEWF
jgi:translocator protein